MENGEISADEGSSPHARGAPFAPVHDLRNHGIIPACAGSTRYLRGVGHEIGDHPRMRGEHSYVVRPSTTYTGSSPHARGAPGRGPRIPRLLGIIPACAGSTTPAERSPRPPRDHPRMRGEHVALDGLEVAASGIIPACAGSTRSSCRTDSPTGDHPRMRGEHFPCHVSDICASGSSPHARGAHLKTSGNPSSTPTIASLSPACNSTAG